MRLQRRHLGRSIVLLLVTLLAMGAAACGGDTPDSAAGTSPGVPSAEEARSIAATPIDVRTPEEYSEGYVTGAQLIDIQASDFDTRIAELDPTVTYVVYCRSGNRSATAATRMRDAGLEVLDGGGLDDMAEAGWPTSK
jgi:rhodanese-related sulfurtransferase